MKKEVRRKDRLTKRITRIVKQQDRLEAKKVKLIAKRDGTAKPKGKKKR